jgi:hypothetical protein
MLTIHRGVPLCGHATEERKNGFRGGHWRCTMIEFWMVCAHIYRSGIKRIQRKKPEPKKVEPLEKKGDPTKKRGFYA